MNKEIRSLFCPQCKKTTKFENNPQSLSAGGVLWKLICALGWLLIPFIGWIFSIYLIIQIFTEKKDTKKFYCCTCGTCVNLSKK